MIEQTLFGKEPPDSQDIKQRLMTGVLDAVTSRIAEGFLTERIRVMFADTSDHDKKENQEHIAELALLFNNRGHIIMCNHTAPDNMVQRNFSALLPYGGSTPLDALMMIELLNQTRTITEYDKRPPPPLILQGANFGSSEEDERRTLRDMHRLEIALRQKVSIAPVLPGTFNATNLVAIRSAVTRLAMGGSVIIFPEHEYTQPEDLKNHTIQGGVSVIARLASAPILPIYILGSESYPAVLTLPGSQSKRHVAVCIGTPVFPKTIDALSRAERKDAFEKAQDDAWKRIVQMQAKLDHRFT